MKPGNLEPAKHMKPGSFFVMRYPDGHLQLAQLKISHEGEKIRWLTIRGISCREAGALPIMDLLFDPGQAKSGEQYPYIFSFVD
jgi:hypothetical protein